MQRYTFVVAAAAAALLLSRAPAMAGDYGSHDTSTDDLKTSGAMENTQPGTMNPTDQAPAMVVPGSATPGTDMKAGEIEATGKPSKETDVIDTTGKTGATSDELEAAGKTGTGPDTTGAAGTIQSDEDAEANADVSFDSPLQQRNLKEAMDPKNAAPKSKKTGTASNAKQGETGNKDMPN